MQSIENMIQTEVVYTALGVALERLQKLGERDLAPHSPLGLLIRARGVRKAELIVKVKVLEEERQWDQVEAESKRMSDALIGGPPSS